MPRPLNKRQLKFVERYLLTGNATQSYIDAGFTKDRESARRAASKLLTNVDVRAPVAPKKQAAETEQIQRIEITRDRIRQEYAKIAFANPKRLFNPDGTAKLIH